jgi:drug/metabolite transporter (DMT)-like permease
LTGVLFACVAGVFFGAMNITMRRAVDRVADVDAGSAVIATVAFLVVGAAAVVARVDLDPGELWPFFLLGIFVPGLTQL